MKIMKKSVKEMQNRWKAEEYKYALGVYKPNKNCKPCVVNGTQYASKKQACVLEGITMSELNEYLKNA